GTVNFAYNSAEDYNDGLPAVTQTNALIVTSTKNFNVTVKAGGKNFEDGKNSIPVSVLTIKASGGSMDGSKKDVELSDKEQTLVGKASLGSKLTLDLDYEIPAEKSSSSDILGKPAGTYTQTVTYTATAL
ncbi:peptidoglycan-binding protein LysM, partial [Arenibacter amylolyticus]|uniref:peptidoglycan-binding protein LysM n=1 Tax=Arenibacter amylolyticus TaxID=1406873 RepID=UPI000A3A7FB6